MWRDHSLTASIALTRWSRSFVGLPDLPGSPDLHFFLCLTFFSLVFRFFLSPACRYFRSWLSYSGNAARRTNTTTSSHGTGSGRGSHSLSQWEESLIGIRSVSTHRRFAEEASLGSVDLTGKMLVALGTLLHPYKGGMQCIHSPIFTLHTQGSPILQRQAAP
jgi:hypothetical protein